MTQLIEHNPIIVYEWTITKAPVDPQMERVVGPRAAARNSEAIEADQRGEPFRMYDDDGVLYFEGVFCGNEETSGFEPLEDLGYAYGCTEIKYLNRNFEWESL